MAIQPDVLTKATIAAFRSKMKEVSPDAVPTEAQEIIAKAVVVGTTNALKATKIASILTFPIKTPGKTGTGLKMTSTIMVQAAVKKMQQLLGSTGGKALTKSMEAFMEPMADHYGKFVEVQAIGAFGGQGLSPINMTTEIIYASIIKELPADKATQILASKAGKNFIMSVSDGISKGMIVAIPGPVPFGSTPPSPGIFTGKFI